MPTVRRIKRKPAPAPQSKQYEYEDDEESSTRAKNRRNSEPDGDDEEDEDEYEVSGGWNSFDRERQAARTGDFPEELKVTEEDTLVKFIDQAPFANYRQHWIELPGKKSWTCALSTGQEECPLCDIGAEIRVRSVFNVIDMSEKKPKLKVLVVGVKAGGQLKTLNGGKLGPLPKHYWTINRSGKGQQTAYNFNNVRERDLADDWDIQPLDDDAFDEYKEKRYTAKAVPGHSAKKLQEIADAAMEAGLVGD